MQPGHLQARRSPTEDETHTTYPFTAVSHNRAYSPTCLEKRDIGPMPLIVACKRKVEVLPIVSHPQRSAQMQTKAYFSSPLSPLPSQPKTLWILSSKTDFKCPCGSKKFINTIIGCVTSKCSGGDLMSAYQWASDKFSSVGEPL
ncbi:hypothetical protein LMH87_005779 [Akanthomyces muscarius]|uniref:CFEM domain-containing protein n=1 Tax=Akanthomyces muscarius TaxID=2231603 RepID=A0A9W8USC2_AKAMU|nr:hypothetical protein LMH87_005779 [Akanthomyces muscarius]KAJ4164093.1 hypothetical protein LMH87_005779 [Akanthomyces muscarius]